MLKLHHILLLYMVLNDIVYFKLNRNNNVDYDKMS